MPMNRMLLPIIKKYWKLFISIMLVSAMGCSIMTGLSGAYVSLETSLNEYVKDYSYPDAVITTDVTTRSQIAKLKKLNSVAEVNARICGDTYMKNKQGRYLSVRVFSYHPEDLQKFYIWTKAESDDQDAIFLEYNFAEDNGIKAGDTVSVKVGQEYRNFFISGIVSMPETLSVQPTDDSWGVNTDFGYAYFPVSLLEKEWAGKYDSVKNELDEKQSDLSRAWDDAQKELDEAEKKLEEAKQQLADKEQLYTDSYEEANQKLLQLSQAKKELEDTQKTLDAKKIELTKTKKVLEDTISQLKNHQNDLNKAAESLAQIDKGISDIDSLTASLSSEDMKEWIDLFRQFPDMKLSQVTELKNELEQFVMRAQAYGFTYDITDKVTVFTDKIQVFINKAEEDYKFMNSNQAEEILLKIAAGDESVLVTEEYEKLMEIMNGYLVYNRYADFETNFMNTRDVLKAIHDSVEQGDLNTVVMYLPQIGSDKSLSQMLTNMNQMNELVDQLSLYINSPIRTAGELTAAYDKALTKAQETKAELILQRKQITDKLEEYGLSEEEIKSPDLIENKLEEAENGLVQINDGIKQIDEGKTQIKSKLAEIDNGTEQIHSQLSQAESQISQAKKEISENEKKLNTTTADSLKEFSDLKTELDKAYRELEAGEGYEVFCNQFLIYFKDGVDNQTAELEKLEEILEEVSVKSSFLYQDSAVKKRIDANLEPIETMSIFMPMIFFIVILIVVFMFMSLMIKQSRREIGILRALGFSRTKIKLLFCGVNLMVSVISILLGSLIGYCLMRYVGSYYTKFFPLPAFRFEMNWKMYVLSVILTMAVGQIATIISAGTISRIRPSEAMSRPAPETAEIPKVLQKLTANSSPMTKFSIASMLRNKMRFVFSVICVAASVMMIFSSLAFITSKNYLLHQLYDERIHYDCQIFFKEQPTDEFIKKLNALEFVSDAQSMPYYQVDIQYGGKSQRAVINGVDKNTKLVGIYDRQDQKITVPEEDMILEKHLAEELGVDIGEEVEINGISVKVAEISDQSVSRFQYTSYETAEKFGTVTLGSVICNIPESDEQKLLAFLTENDNYLYTVFTRLSYQGNEKIFKTYDLAAWIIISFAIIIGLVIVINTAQTNLLEKKKELCILRTLGFQHREISRKWFVQSFLQFIFSCIIGLPTGVYLAKIALQKLSTDGREYVFANHFPEYLFTVLLVLAYIVISHLIAMHSMKKWDMVESVKDKE